MTKLQYTYQLVDKKQDALIVMCPGNSCRNMSDTEI